MLPKHENFTTLPFSNYASAIFAQQNPNDKIRLLVDLRQINKLISDVYKIYNHPVSTLTDAVQHMAVRNVFCKLDCSQAYHCLQIADQLCRNARIQFHHYNPRISETAHGLSRSLSRFSSFVRGRLFMSSKQINAHYRSITMLLPQIRPNSCSTTYEQF